MRLLFIIDNLGSGGAQRQMVSLAVNLSRRGHPVEFVIYNPRYQYFLPTLQEAGIPVRIFPKKNAFPLKFVFDLRQQIKKGGYNLVLSFLDMPGLYAEVASIGIRNLCLVVSERNSYPGQYPTFRKRLLEQAYHLADHITVNTHYQSRLMRNFNPWMSDRVSVIYNGLDLKCFKPSASLPIQENVFLSVGSITPRKNVVGLARMLVEYKRAYGSPPVIHWVGAIHQTKSSKREYERVNKLLADSRLEKHWCWLGECSQIEELYHQYPVLILPSFREGLSNVICEAMACGLPVLASRIGEQPRIVEEGITGFLFDPNSPEEMAQTVSRFLSLSKEKKRDMGAASRAFAEKEFGLELFIDKYENLFRSLILDS